jgi:predicted phage terminase large subunit-like protein
MLIRGKSDLVRKAFQRPLNVEAELCRRSLFYFMKTFWKEVSGDTPSWNWHIPYLCSQLMRIAHRAGNGLPKEHDMIVNIPPGTTKSITCSVMFPAWAWTNWPHLKFITISYAAALSLELGEYSRDILRSKKYRDLFPHLTIKQDKDTKSNYRIQYDEYDEEGNFVATKQGGNRISTSVGGTLTGFHGHILLVDDPLDPNRAVSEVELKSANRWLDHTLSTRKVDKQITSTVLIMQRLHQDDPTGHLLAKQKDNVFHICLPGEARAYKELIKPPGLIAHYQDELLDPNRMPWHVLKELEADLGQYGYAGQIGQNPTPPAGGMFQPDNIMVVTEPSSPIVGRVVRYWDKAATQDAGCFTVGAKLAKLANGKYCILHVERGQWASDAREAKIVQTARHDGEGVHIYMEQEGGSAGKDSVQISIRGLDGFIALADHPTGDKVTRADPFSVQVNAGNVEMIQGAWNKALTDELRMFPFGKFKDQVDAISGAYNKLRKNTGGQVFSFPLV